MDRKRLALIHILKKECGLNEEDYRAALRQSAGVESSKQLSEAGFRKLLLFLIRRRRITEPQKRFIRSLADEMGWDELHLQLFIRKYYHREILSTLSRKEAAHLIESLKNVRRHSS